MKRHDRKRALEKRGNFPRRRPSRTGRFPLRSRKRRGSGGRFRPFQGLNVPRVLVIGTLGLSLILFLVALFRPGGILDVIQLSDRVLSVREDIETLAAENESLRGQIKRLRSDRRAIERVARDDLGLVRPGETVYEFIAED